MPELSPPRIVCAAQRRDDGAIVIGARHFDHMMVMAIKSRSDYNPDAFDWQRSESGFVDQHGKFWTREEAWVIADKNGQIWRDRDWFPGLLHSEHLY